MEIGELANEWRGFKHWSNDREARTRTIKSTGYNHEFGAERGVVYNPLLEEYAGGLHFVLSIGRQIGFDLQTYEHEDLTKELVDITEAFNHSFHWAGQILFYIDRHLPNTKGAMKCYYRLLDVFVSLGTMLGFTWEQIVEDYVDKHKTNYDRQENNWY